MGLRGPGAKPIKRLATPAKGRTRRAWDRRGLSRVARVIAFLEALPVTSGPLAGTGFKVRPWQASFLEIVYALDASGGRPVRTAVFSAARKQGKSGLAAGLALCHLAGPESEPRGQVYSAANDRAQAALLYAEMAAVVERVPFLGERISLRRHAKEMEDFETGSVYAALSADVPGKHGLSPSCVIYDELGQAAKRDLFDALDTAMGGRAQPLMVVISTQAASDEAPLSELIDYGLRVTAGEVIDPAFHLTLYTAPEEADPWTEETWRLANPALGDFRSLDDVRRLAAQAQRIPTKEAAFRQLVLNQRVAAETRFLPVSEWRACGEGVPLAELDGRPCWAALDLGATRDLTALILTFPGEGRTDVLARFFLPADGLRERAERDRVPYDVWRERGLLTATPGATTDPRFVAAAVAELRTRYRIEALAYDRWRIETFRQALADEGVTDVTLIPHGQGYRDMGPAVDALERAVAERRLRHGNHPILTWCIGNAVVTRDPAGNAKLDKARSTGRIDGAVALAMSLSAAQMKPAEAAWEPLCMVV